jgi:hypothetical protein
MRNEAIGSPAQLGHLNLVATPGAAAKSKCQHDQDEWEAPLNARGFLSRASVKLVEPSATALPYGQIRLDRLSYFWLPPWQPISIGITAFTLIVRGTLQGKYCVRSDGDYFFCSPHGLDKEKKPSEGALRGRAARDLALKDGYPRYHRERSCRGR